MTDDPPAILGQNFVGPIEVVEPCLAHVENHFQVILGDVTQVICHRPAHVKLWIVLEQFQQWQ